MHDPSVLWYNPKCSKCRDALALLQRHGVEPTLRRYLDDPPTRAELDDILSKLDAPPISIVRAKELAATGLSQGSPRPALLDAIARQPALLERPIFVHGKRAVVARPPERVLELLEE